jgi:hypothetical protein
MQTYLATLWACRSCPASRYVEVGEDPGPCGQVTSALKLRTRACPSAMNNMGDYELTAD